MTQAGQTKTHTHDKLDHSKLSLAAEIPIKSHVKPLSLPFWPSAIPSAAMANVSVYRPSCSNARKKGTGKGRA